MRRGYRRKAAAGPIKLAHPKRGRTRRIGLLPGMPTAFPFSASISRRHVGGNHTTLPMGYLAANHNNPPLVAARIALGRAARLKFSKCFPYLVACHGIQVYLVSKFVPTTKSASYLRDDLHRNTAFYICSMRCL